MSDHINNINDGSMSRFGSFKCWHKPNDPQTEHDSRDVIFTQNDPCRDHVCRPVIIGSDGRAKLLVPDFFKHHHNHDHKQTKTVVEERAQFKDYVTTNEPRKGFSAGMFQRMRNDYREPQPGLTTEGGWVRPSPAGWKLAPEEALMDGMNGGRKDGKIIDSREVPKRYGGRFSF